MNINKNVSIWRGNNPPPSQYHLWQKDDVLLHYNGLEWVENKVPMSSADQDGLMSKEDKEKLDSLVYDGLDSNDGNKALSAKQGAILLSQINSLNLSVYKPRGSVESLEDLPIDNLEQGNVYNILTPFYIDGKRYPEGTNIAWTGTEWDPLGGVVDLSAYSTTEEIEDMIGEQRSEIGDILNNISLVLYNQHSELNASVSPTIIELGVNTNVILTWDFKFNGVSLNPDSITITENGASISTNKTITRTINDTTTYNIVAQFKGIAKSKTLKVNAYEAMYFGSANTLTDVTTLTKQSIKDSPAGDYSIAISENQYVWWCVPNTMTINSIKSESFEVPIEAPITIGNYKCYRTTNRLKAGILNCTIS